MRKLINSDVKLGENTLLLEALTSLGIDFPFEWGSNSNGEWEKWISGKLIQRGKTTQNLGPYSTAVGDGYYRCNPILSQFPIPFVGKIPIVKGDVSLNGVGFVYKNRVPSLLDTGVYVPSKPSISTTDVIGTLDWTAEGWWK